MIRHVVAVAAVLCLNPVWVSAQTPTFTVTAAPASVYKAPSTGSPVIGTAPRGTVVDVQRELGSWVAIPWPAAENAVAYLHVSTGTIARTTAPTATRTAAAAAPAVAAMPSASVSPAREAQTSSQMQRPMPVSTPQAFVAPPLHVIGLGARLGTSSIGFGVSGRGWQKNRLGVQVAVSHAELTSVIVSERLSSLQIEPSLLYSFRDRVSDYVWLRPYLGSGVSVLHQRLQVPGAIDSVSRNRLGVQAFGGSEFSMPNWPRFAVSGEVSYRWSEAPILPGFDVNGLGFSVSGHWYVK